MLKAWSKSTFKAGLFTGEYRTAFLFIGKADLPTAEIYLSRDLKHVRLVVGGVRQEGVVTGPFADWVKRFLQRRLSP